MVTTKQIYYDCGLFNFRFTINDVSNMSYIHAIDKCFNTDPQLIMLCVPNNNGDR